MALTIDTRRPQGTGRAGALTAPSMSARARAFQLARRHSLLVRALRVALPAAAVGIVCLYALQLTTSWKIGPGRLNTGKIEVTPDDLTMKNPSYFGVTKDGGRYEVRAKKAVLEFNRQAPIKLFDIDGDLVQANNVTTKLTAKHGLLDNTKSEMELYDGIEIDASNGLSARLSRATVYSKEHRVVSPEPVTATMPTGSVKAAAMTMRTDTREASFRQNVVVQLNPAASQTTVAFGRDARQPVEITAEQLDVNDAQHNARFHGSVVAMQAETTLKTPELQIEYEGGAAAGMAGKASPGGANSNARLKLVQARGGVVMTIGADRRVTSDQADFDARAETALFAGNVLVHQGKNVLQGRRLLVDRKTGRSRLEAPGDAGQPAGRIAATFYQAETKTPAQVAKAKAAAAVDAAQSNLLGTFKTDPNAPLDVEADTLDVNDGTKQATFRGNVKAQQGDFVVRTRELVATYSGQTALGSGAADDPAAKEGAQLTRVEAKEKVLITSKDGQSATGDWAIFDIKANTVLLGGRVVVTRGKDVVEGPRLKIDLTTGMYRFELEGEGEATSAAPASASPAATPPPAAAVRAPAASSSPAETPTGRTCPPGKQCLLFYPKEAQDKAKDTLKKLAPPETGGKPKDGWQPTTSSSPVLRGE